MKKLIITLILCVFALINYAQTPAALILKEVNYQGRMLDSIYFRLAMVEMNYTNNKLYAYMDTYLHRDAFDAGVTGTQTVFVVDFTTRPGATTLTNLYIDIKAVIINEYGLTNDDIELIIE